MEIAADLSVLDSVLNVGLDPVLYAIGNSRAAVDQGDTRAGPPELEGRNGGGVFSSDHGNIVVVEGMRLLVIVEHFIEVLAGDIQPIWHVVVTRSENDFLHVVS